MRVVTTGFCTIYRNVALGEVGDFLDDLSAPAARGDGIDAGGNFASWAACNCDGDDLFQLTVAIGFSNCHGFCAQRHAVTGIFEIGSADDAAVLEQQRRADMEIGIRRISIAGRSNRGFDQRGAHLRTTAQRTGPSMPATRRAVFAVHITQGRAE